MISKDQIKILANRFDEKARESSVKEDKTEFNIETETKEVLNKSDYLTKRELKDCIRWKLNSQGGRSKTNCERLDAVSDEVVENITRAAFKATTAEEAPKKQIKILSSLPGIGPATATVPLAFNDPENRAVGDRIINGVFLADKEGEKITVSPTNYGELLEALSERSKGLPLRTVEKAYYLSAQGG